MVGRYLQKKEEEKQIEEEQAAKARYEKIPICYDDDDDEYTIAITHKEPDNPLSMGDEHLDTILATKSDEFIKSSVENLVPNLSESECEYEFDEDILKKIYSDPLFDEEIISIKIDPHHFNAEYDLIESLLNHDSSIISSSLKIDSLLDEFAGELTLLKSISSGINKIDCDPENEIRLIKRLLYDNSSPHQPEEFISEISDASFESFSPSPIIPFHFLKMSHFILIFLRPLSKPPDGNSGILNVKVMGDISEHKVPLPRHKLTLVPNQEKYPNLSPHLGHKASQPSTECPMMIYGKNTPILDVPLFHFYPP
uniref:Reverse transcriptase domain-containing protein n=1 Tax=Tanacetum cinerariifolium TaxID=118510 RepID=A0A6L2J5V1_TANCI|nr:hypothetical protein [Tanacetum cinerariifolium]